MIIPRPGAIVLVGVDRGVELVARVAVLPGFGTGEIWSTTAGQHVLIQPDADFEASIVGNVPALLAVKGAEPRDFTIPGV